jgi:hypothetical protein
VIADVNSWDVDQALLYNISRVLLMNIKFFKDYEKGKIDHVPSILVYIIFDKNICIKYIQKYIYNVWHIYDAWYIIRELSNF